MSKQQFHFYWVCGCTGEGLWERIPYQDFEMMVDMKYCGML